MNAFLPLLRADDLVHDRSGEWAPPWSFSAMVGRLVEIVQPSASAALTVTVDLLEEAQSRDESCAWVSTAESVVYPPDLARRGVNPRSLLMVRVPETTGVARSVEYLVRSGGFGLIVADFTAGSTRKVESSFTARLVRLLRVHQVALVCLTRQASLGSMVSLRMEARREYRQGAFATEIRVIKDRVNGQGALHREQRHGPDGLR